MGLRDNHGREISAKERHGAVTRVGFSEVSVTHTKLRNTTIEGS